MFARDLGIDVWEAIDAAESKPFGFMPFRPGPGVGGHCLPDRPVVPVVAGQAVAGPDVPVRRAGQRGQRAHARLRDPAPRRRAQRPGAVRSRAGASWCSAWPTRGTPATTASPRAPAIIELLELLKADVAVCDPHVDPDRSHAAGDRRARRAHRRARSRAADAVVVLVDHDAFDLDMVARRGHLRARHPPLRDRSGAVERLEPPSRLRTMPRSLPRALLVEARPKQWVKNLLVFAAPAAAGVIDEPKALLQTIAAFACFCLAASGTYYLNDAADVEADRLHPKKRFRPIAAGEIPLGTGPGRSASAAIVAVGRSRPCWSTGTWPWSSAPTWRSPPPTASG